MDATVRAELVAFLRRFLPPEARATYRAMMDADPPGWHLHPHFAGGVIPRMLRGNGYTDRLVGESLDAVWPQLLRDAVAER